MLILEMLVVIFGMIFLCFFTSGIANIPGSIFEKKSTVAQRVEDKGTVRGGRKAT
jgi:hypothetical protein